MTFPAKPTCHGEMSPVFQIRIEWRPPHTEYKDRQYRSCSYCGRIHPEDLLNLLDKGARLGGSDWKYGWPHKFYLREKEGAPSLNGKFYAEHFLDAGYSESTKMVLSATILKHTGIRFTIEEGILKYAAPYHGYQV